MGDTPLHLCPTEDSAEAGITSQRPQRIFHGGVFSMPTEGKKGDLKKFGFVVGLRATDMLNNLLIWALDTEAMEGFCLSDSVSIL